MFKTTAAVLLTLSALGATPAAFAQAGAPAAAPAAKSCPAILQHSFNRLQDEAPQDLCQYAGKVVLVVNTASYCGFTSQYQGLEKLYAKYGKQEPGSAKEIADFCYNTYGVKFPMFAKSSVKGTAANPLHASLIKQTGKEPKWNFTKYLIDRNGKVLEYFPSKVEPEDKALVSKVEAALAS